jgi:hypothetical protein
MEPFKWSCPHCGLHQIVTDPCYYSEVSKISVSLNAWGDLAYSVNAIVCSSKECNKPTVSFGIYNGVYNGNGFFRIIPSKKYFQKQLIPSSTYQNYPEYIPLAIRQDYEEACLIKELGSGPIN